METEIGKVTLKEFVKYNPDYIRVYPKQNKLYGIAKNISVTVNGIKKQCEVTIETEIPVFLYIQDNFYESKDTRDIPIEIHLHSSEARSLLTLLALNPLSLEIRYWHNGMSKEWTAKHDLKMEALYISGLVKKQTFEVAIEHNYDTDMASAKWQKLARWE
jgi:hypothetical protein